MLFLNLYSLAREAENIDSESMVKLLDDVVELLRCRRHEGSDTAFDEHLAVLEPKGEAVVVGDLHADLESLVLILRESAILQKMEKNADVFLIFLGDYGDRGDKPAQVLYVVLKLKQAFPSQVILLRGNHEAPEALQASPHDLPSQFQDRFGEDWQLIYSKTRELWNHLSNAVVVKGRLLMVHGGVSREIAGINDVAAADEHNNLSLLEKLLWSDPVEGLEGESFSPRGAGRLFGEDVTNEVLQCLGVKVLIRGHEPTGTGFKINHNGKVLTLFSRKGAPYFNRYGAYLQLPLSRQYESAEQLLPFIHKF